VIGPVEAVIEMAAFFSALALAGWRPGQAFPTGHALAAASGAAFAAVVLGQVGNAFACRSTSVWPGRLGWKTNRLLVVAVASSVVALIASLVVGPFARLLGQAPPPAGALVVAAAAAPAVLLVDALHKRRLRRLHLHPGS
jgi:hypothetical protein